MKIFAIVKYQGFLSLSFQRLCGEYRIYQSKHAIFKEVVRPNITEQATNPLTSFNGNPPFDFILH